MTKDKEITNLPSPASGSLSLYLSQIKKFPMLDAEEEYVLGKELERKRQFKSCTQISY